MLTLTENASTIVKGITTQEGSPEEAGLRISAEAGAEAAFAIAPAEEAQPGDQVLDQDGAKLYLDAPAAEQLDDKVLDAGVDSAGNVEFSLSVQG